MEKNFPNYSVLMSVYYKEKPDWLDYSIRSMMNQTIKCDEFVLVEDGPLTDELYKVINSYLKEFPNIFKVIKFKENKGLGIALKIGVENCSNEFIARMDSDDYSIPTRIEKQFDIFEKNPDLGLVGSNVAEFNGSISNVICDVLLPETQNKIYKFSKTRCPFRHPSLLFKKSEIIAAGNYRSFYLYEDYDLYVRLLRNNCKCYNFQENLVYMRVSEDFYKRRGGIRYLKSILKFKNEQLSNGYFSKYDYFKSTFPHVIVCLMPNALRDWVYRNLLRKRRKD